MEDAVVKRDYCPWTAGDRQRLQEMVEKDMPLRTIAKLLQRPYATVRAAVQRFGFARPGGHRTRQKFARLFGQMYRQGCSDHCIALALGVSAATVGAWRRRRRLPPHSRAGVDHTEWTRDLLRKRRRTQTQRDQESRRRLAGDGISAGRGGKEIYAIDRGIYDADTTQFVLTMGELKRRLGRMPTCGEILEAARKLGWTKSA